MEKKQYEIIETLLRAGKDERLHAGRLMSPEELRRAVYGRSGPEKQFEGWFLCGTAHPAMYSACVKSETQTAVVTLNDYFVAIQQCETWQSRIVLPVAGEHAIRFVHAMNRGAELQLSLANGNQDDTFISLVGPITKTIPGHQENSRTGAGDDVILAALPGLVCLLLQPNALDSIGHSPVTDVCVTFVLPEEKQPPSVLSEIGKFGQSIH